MAKSKSKSPLLVASVGLPPNASIHLDVSPADLNDLEIGDKVTVKIEGTVTALAKRKGYADPPDDTKTKPYGELTLEYKRSTLKRDGDNVFTTMAEED